MSRFCPNCGSQLDDNTAFCLKCGKEINGQTNSDAFEQNGAPETRVNPVRGNIGRAVTVIAVLIVITLIISIAVSVIKNSDPKSSAEKIASEYLSASLKENSLNYADCIASPVLRKELGSGVKTSRAELVSKYAENLYEQGEKKYYGLFDNSKDDIRNVSFEAFEVADKSKTEEMLESSRFENYLTKEERKSISEYALIKYEISYEYYGTAGYYGYIYSDSSSKAEWRSGTRTGYILTVCMDGKWYVVSMKTGY